MIQGPPGYKQDVNEKQKRVIKFLGTGAIIGLITGFCLPNTVGKADQVLSCSIFGMACGAVIAWFTSLR